MATLSINFLKVNEPIKGTTYPDIKCVGSYSLVGRKMTSAWVKKNYGEDCNDIIYYVRRYASNPIGEMWVVGTYSKYDGSYHWSVTPISNVKLPFNYNKIIVK